MFLVFAGSPWSLCAEPGWGCVGELVLGIFREGPSLVSALPPNLDTRTMVPAWTLTSSSQQRFSFFLFFISSFFGCGSLLKSFYWTCHHIASVLCCFIFWPRGVWDLSSQTRNWTCTRCIGRQSLNPSTTRQFPSKHFLWPSLYPWPQGTWSLLHDAHGLVVVGDPKCFKGAEHWVPLDLNDQDSFTLNGTWRMSKISTGRKRRARIF